VSPVGSVLGRPLPLPRSVPEQIQCHRLWLWRMKPVFLPTLDPQVVHDRTPSSYTPSVTPTGPGKDPVRTIFTSQGPRRLLELAFPIETFRPPVLSPLSMVPYLSPSSVEFCFESFKASSTAPRPVIDLRPSPPGLPIFYNDLAPVTIIRNYPRFTITFAPTLFFVPHPPSKEVTFLNNGFQAVFPSPPRKSPPSLNRVPCSTSQGPSPPVNQCSSVTAFLFLFL